ncbi:hypothetical protein chiPu_0027586 [Chiloscyllium punctatum]|uniref:Uncharacterized protein n=1 Tax=Chiloscyllium punctatum TaxID=137246 RepID=A0A401TL46_CHIPU|nr:hypothetical protein [Chiloscyllium punctatum]
MPQSHCRGAAGDECDGRMRVLLRSWALGKTWNPSLARFLLPGATHRALPESPSRNAATLERKSTDGFPLALDQWCSFLQFYWSTQAAHPANGRNARK